MLKHISNLINTGRPLWALLMANENKSSNEFLNRALRQKAQMVIDENPEYLKISETVTKLLSGATLVELNEGEQILVREFKENAVETKSYQFFPNPTLRARSTRVVTAHMRRAVAR